MFAVGADREKEIKIMMRKSDITEADFKIWMSDADIDHDKIHRAYGGRGMYNRTCVGFTGNLTDLAKFLIQVATNEDTEGGPDLANELADCLSTDSMGRESIFYFPGTQFADAD